MAFEIQTSKGTRSILNDEEQPQLLSSSCASIPPIHMESHPYHSQNRYYNPSNTPTTTPFYRNGSISLPPLPCKSQGYPVNNTNNTTVQQYPPPRSSALDFYSNPPSPPIVPASRYSYPHQQFQPMMAPPVHIPHYHHHQQQQQQQQIYSLPSPSSPIQPQQYAPTTPTSTLPLTHPSPTSLPPTVPVSPVSPNTKNSSDQSKPSTSSRSKITAATPKPIKKYICSHCSRSFTTSGHLARHTRIHTGEKNYECPHDDCHMRFSRQDNCMQHYRTHLGGRSRVGRGRGRKANNVPHAKPNNTPVTTINSLLSNANDINLPSAKFEPIN